MSRVSTARSALKKVEDTRIQKSYVDRAVLKSIQIAEMDDGGGLGMILQDLATTYTVELGLPGKDTAKYAKYAKLAFGRIGGNHNRRGYLTLAQFKSICVRTFKFSAAEFKNLTSEELKTFVEGLVGDDGTFIVSEDGPDGHDDIARKAIEDIKNAPELKKLQSKIDDIATRIAARGARQLKRDQLKQKRRDQREEEKRAREEFNDSSSESLQKMIVSQLISRLNQNDDLKQDTQEISRKVSNLYSELDAKRKVAVNGALDNVLAELVSAICSGDVKSLPDGTQVQVQQYLERKSAIENLDKCGNDVLNQLRSGRRQ